MAFEGTSEFRYTPPGATELTVPAKLRNLHPRRVDRRFTWWAADFTARNDVVVGSGVYDVEARIRFVGDPQAVLDMLAHGANGVVLTYYPDSGSPSVNYPSTVVDVGETVALQQDEHRYGSGEYETRVRLRHASGGTWEGLL